MPLSARNSDVPDARPEQSKEPRDREGGEDATMALTMEMYDFGAEVDVEPPPDDEVIDLQELGLGG